MRLIWLYLITKYHLFLIPLLITVTVEYLQRGQLRPVASWGKNYFYEFLLNFLIAFSLLLLLIAVIGKASYAFWILSAVLIVTALVSGIKYRILGIPLLPWDIVLNKEAGDMAVYLNKIFSRSVICGSIGFSSAGWLLLYKTPFFQIDYSWLERSSLAVISTLLLFSLYTNNPIKLKNPIHVIPWDQARNYMRNGFLLSSLLNANHIFVPKPEGYSKAAIDSIIKDFPRQTNSDTSSNPNIIVVLSEAFWDPSRIPNLKLSEDPIPFFRSLLGNYPSGWLLSPQFGGGTANVELEVLTGNTIRFMPEGSIPYMQYVNHGIDSLASILTRQGYTTTAINPYHNWFYNSRNVYKYFGFSKFISSEFFRQVKKGPFLADSETINNVIEETKKTPGPNFIFANTMQNHAFYSPKKFKKKTIFVESDLPAQSKSMLEALATGLRDADNSLKQLVDYYNKVAEPTIIVFFGDHLPLLGNDYQVYRETNYITPNDPDFLAKMYETPIVIWNNYLPPNNEKLYMSTSFLAPYILHIAQKEGTYYTDYLYNLYKRYQVLPPPHYYKSMQIDPNDKQLKDYELLQYDIMFGEYYGLKDLKDQILKKDFFLGYGDILIHNVTPNKLKSGALDQVSITLSGKYLPELGKVFINARQADTTPGPAGTLIALISKKMYEQAGSMEVQVKLIDSKKTVIKKSNVYKINVFKEKNWESKM